MKKLLSLTGIVTVVAFLVANPCSPAMETWQSAGGLPFNQMTVNHEGNTSSDPPRGRAKLFLYISLDEQGTATVETSASSHFVDPSERNTRRTVSLYGTTDEVYIYESPLYGYTFYQLMIQGESSFDEHQLSVDYVSRWKPLKRRGRGVMGSVSFHIRKATGELFGWIIINSYWQNPNGILEVGSVRILVDQNTTVIFD